MIAECKHCQSVAAATLIAVEVAVSVAALAAGEGAEDPAMEWQQQQMKKNPKSLFIFVCAPAAKGCQCMPDFAV